MATPQSIVAPSSRAAVILVGTIADGGEQTVRDLLPDLAGIVRSVGFRVPGGGLVCVAGIGSDAWGRLFPDGPRPSELHPFPALDGPVHRAPATPGDLLLHIRAQRADLCFETARLVTDRLGDAFTVVDEVHGFSYFDERDLLGFVDGSENPQGAAATAAVHLTDEDPPFRGGSYVVVQKYLHDMEGWAKLTTEDQERAIGRSKLANVEFPDEDKPADSHVALNTIVGEDGKQRQILRSNMPFGAVGTASYGTLFIGYARTPSVTEQMLRHMFLGNPPGTTDRILDFSTAVTGGLFFVPSADFLDAVGS
ncbi:putative iron-dependent peroxidase [Streptacidiphilus sp. MAP12-33]|uniref:Dyp-type peroxidase n=1 Tax=Streptacidiphilus sp. MAP12-33 TaxID=3156266 RepID=UPI0035171501